MAYQAIYRRWRPTTFDDVVGQEHVTKTLKNQIMNNVTAHAYLFCGTRGTGKTSTAKILARAVNCLAPKNGNPCNECSVCKGLLDESILDVTELDGASKNKVENIRDLIDDVVFLPTVARKKVYIIDEVHMVTQQAFNALLKTLEEPPEHVMFILATTELNKVPITVLSRCQQFDFRRITNGDISARMQSILEADGFFAEPAALSLIAELGDGSMRDALSVLDKCVGAVDQTLTYDDVVKIVGIADHEALLSLSQAIAAGDTKTSLEQLDEMIEKGKELSLFADQFMKYLRDILVVKVTGNAKAFLNTSEETSKHIEALTAQFSKERLIRSIDLLCEVSGQVKYSGFSRALYEVAILKMCEPEMEKTHTALLDRISVLESQLKNGVLPPSANAPAENSATEKLHEQPKKESQEEKPPETPQPVENTRKSQAVTKTGATEPMQQKPAGLGSEDAASKWPEVIQYVKTHGGMPLFPHLALVKAKMVGEKLCVVFGEKALVSKSVVSKPANLKLLEEAVAHVAGAPIPVACVTPKEIGENEPDGLKKLEELSKIHPEIEFI